MVILPSLGSHLGAGRGRGSTDMGSRASLGVGRAAAVTECTDRVAAAL